MKQIGTWLVIALATVAFIYGGYWVVKHISYSLWYEDMVKQTVRSMVKPDALRGD